MKKLLFFLALLASVTQPAFATMMTTVSATTIVRDNVRINPPIGYQFDYLDSEIAYLEKSDRSPIVLPKPSDPVCNADVYKFCAATGGQATTVGATGSDSATILKAPCTKLGTEPGTCADGGAVQTTFQGLQKQVTAIPAGPPGPKGDKGDEGQAGIQGPKGDTGATGLKGDKGDPGANGANGTNGVDGQPGSPGLKGDKGDTGTAGAKGDKGDPGLPGTNGANGTDGQVGAKGDQGAPGVPGSKGDTGAPGLKGDTGATGATGSQGTAGTPGVKGDKGDPGAAGTNGTNGVDGQQGIQGLPGTNGTNGTNGAKGDKGDTGLQGIQGLPGANGANGATGATGAQGIQGIQGLPGTNGATGATGAAGPANTIAAFNYASYPVVINATVQIGSGIVDATLTGSPILGTVTIKLPAAPVDKQTCIIMSASGLTISSMTIQDANGTAVGSGLALGSLGHLTFQYQSTAWKQLGT